VAGSAARLGAGDCAPSPHASTPPPAPGQIPQCRRSRPVPGGHECRQGKEGRAELPVGVLLLEEMHRQPPGPHPKRQRQRSATCRQKSITS
jgi:hypothetical protein